MGKFNIRTIFAYDWPLTLAGMEHIAGDVCAIDLVGVCRTPDELVATLDTLDCDIALVDYSVRGDAQMNGCDACVRTSGSLRWSGTRIR